MPGSAESWEGLGTFGATFSVNVVNSHGDYVIAGFTTGEPGFGVVFVFNGQVELFRTNTQVDLDGDGLANDGRSLINLREDTVWLTDAGRLYFTSDLGGGGLDDEAFMWMPVPVPGELNCDGQIDFFDIDPFLECLFAICP